MDTKEPFFSDSLQKFKDYCDDRILLLKLQTVEKLSRVIAIVFAAILLITLSAIILLFLSAAAAYYFASVTGNTAMGFAIVAGIYFVLFLIIIIFGRKIVQNLIINFIVKISLHEETNKEDEQQQ